MQGYLKKYQSHVLQNLENEFLICWLSRNLDNSRFPQQLHNSENTDLDVQK